MLVGVPSNLENTKASILPVCVKSHKHKKNLETGGKVLRNYALLLTFLAAGININANLLDIRTTEIAKHS